MKYIFFYRHSGNRMAIIDVQDVRMRQAGRLSVMKTSDGRERPESRTFKGLLDTGQQLRCFRHDASH